MSHQSLSFSLKRSHVLALLAATAAMAILMLGFRESSAQAENHCVSGEVCSWTGTSYSGTEGSYFCPANVGEGQLQFTEWQSAKNRCGGASIRIGWYEGGVVNWKVCMSPGGERPSPGRWNITERVASC